MVLSYEPAPPSVTCGDIMKKAVCYPFWWSSGEKITVILAGLGGRKCAAELFLRSSWKTLLE